MRQIIRGGKLSRLKTLCFAANPETIHMRGSSVYSVIELEESRFHTYAIWQKKQEIQN